MKRTLIVCLIFISTAVVGIEITLYICSNSKLSIVACGVGGIVTGCVGLILCFEYIKRK